MKDKYRAEGSDRLELVSIEQAKQVALLASYRKLHLPVLWWMQVHRNDQRDYNTTVLV